MKKKEDRWLKEQSIKLLLNIH